MKRLFVSLVLGFSAVLLSGCILLPVPHEQRLSPLFHGVVSDVDSGRPLVGAKVTLRGYGFAEDEIGPIVVRSDMAGHYSVVASRHSTWLPIWLGPAEGLQRGVVTFELEGYVATEAKKEVFTGAMPRAKFEVNVSLKKKEPNQAPEPTAPSGRGSS